MTSGPVTGGCLCKAVRYEFRGDPINVRVCHCRTCQKSLGAPFNVRVLVRIADVTMAGPVGEMQSSDVLKRGFCTRCGTTLYSQRETLGVMGLTCGSLDAPEAFAPAEHIWVSSKQPWLVLADGLPQFAEGPPA